MAGGLTHPDYASLVDPLCRERQRGLRIKNPLSAKGEERVVERSDDRVSRCHPLITSKLQQLTLLRLILNRIKNSINLKVILATMKASQLAVKIVTRLFFILLIVALVPFFVGDNYKLKHLYLHTPNKWTLAFPILLMLGFIALFVLCSIKKYKEADLNWLLVLNTVILMAYGITLGVRIYQMVA